MHIAKESCIISKNSMKEKVPHDASDIAFKVVGSWSFPNPNVWTGIPSSVLLERTEAGNWSISWLPRRKHESMPSDKSMMLATGFLCLRSSRTRVPFLSPSAMLVLPSALRDSTARMALSRPSSDILRRGKTLLAVVENDIIDSRSEGPKCCMTNLTALLTRESFVSPMLPLTSRTATRSMGVPWPLGSSRDGAPMLTRTGNFGLDSEAEIAGNSV